MSNELKKSALLDEINLVATQVAETEAVLSFVINAARTSMNYEEFRSKLDEHLTAVKLTPTVDVEAYLDTFSDGYVVIHKYESDPVEGTTDTDYLRDDDGLPIIFSLSDVIPTSIKVVKTIDLAERNAQK